MDSHIKGELCEHCREIIAEEIGNHLFYLAALCNLLDYDLEELIGSEFNRISTLGHFLLS
jgi:NTP pyrophosphatase (non-canonical NTP hydrolase)